MNLNAPSLTTYEECRAHINRLNAQRSTGPRTEAGKIRSSQNSFKHGLYSKQLIREGEDPAEFEELQAALRREHQPVNTTEEILVNELVHHFWRIRRFREMEARAWAPDTVSECIDSGLLALVTRALAALTKLQKARGFVPQKQEPAPEGACHHVETVEEQALERDAAPAPTPFADAARAANTPASFLKNAPVTPARQKTSAHSLP